MTLNTAFRTLVLLGTGTAVLRCDPTTPERMPRPAEGCPSANCCVSDPHPRCLRIKGCRSDRDCPTGTTCGGARGAQLACTDTGQLGAEHTMDGSLPCCSGGDTPTECQVVNDIGGVENTLTSGFDVPSFPLERTSDAAFQWRAPRGAKAVACALFGCVPDIRAVAGAMHYTAYEIDNYDKCVLARKFVEGRANTDATLARTVDFGKLEPYSPLDGCSAGDADALTSSFLYMRTRPRLTALLVGCWAYDATSIIAATPLLSLTQSPGSLGAGVVPLTDCGNQEGATCVDDSAEAGFFALGVCRGRRCHPELAAADDVPLLADCAAPGRRADGLNCFPSDTGGFGTCVAGACRRRCLTADDCTADGATGEACCRQTVPGAQGPDAAPAPPHATDALTGKNRRETVGACVRPDALVTNPLAAADEGSASDAVGAFATPFRIGSVVCTLSQDAAGGSGGE